MRRRMRPAALLVTTLVSLGICVPAVATAAPATQCTVRLETGEQTCSMRMPAQVNGDVIIGRVFEDQGFRGASYTFTAPHPCKDGNGKDFGVQLAGYGWANRISSVQAWGNCWLQLYSGANYDGSHDGPYKSDTSYVGPQLDKRAQSIAFD